MIVGSVNPSSPYGRILTVEKFLSEPSLTIPLYQRPYKWTEKNVNQLFNDIETHKDKSSYRLGTIVFHQEEGRRNIVDGQQRTITLLLAVRALSMLRKDKLDRKDLKEQLNMLERKMISPSFKSEVSKTNIHKNYLEIRRIVNRPDFTEEHIDFLLNKCEVVTFTLKDVSEAFQFFDSQNARGRDLEPHDLLKAYHLREFCSDDEKLKASTVERWEDSKTEDLTQLFSKYLYRIRSWSNGASARYFGKEDTELFKGINIEKVNRYPYAKQLYMAHNFVDYKNSVFPFNLDQIIINGRRFFEMTAYYQEMIDKYNTSQLIPLEKLDQDAKRILCTLDNYQGRNRTGDQYVRTIFDCLLIYYIDKFGFEEISSAIKKIFICAFSLRLKMLSVKLASMDNHVLKSELFLKNNLFKPIKDAIVPSKFINFTLPVLREEDRRFRNKDTDKIKNLFQDIGYLE